MKLAAIIAAAVLGGALPAAATASGAGLPCGSAPDADGLTEVFAHGFDRLVGADYQRAAALPDGSTLWFFQDAYVDVAGGSPRLVHNAGAVQDGSCFRLLTSGPAGDAGPWIGAPDTRAQHRWFWPLGGVLTDPSTYTVFVAEMREEGDRYLSRTVPVATWTADVDLRDLSVGPLRPAPDPGAEMYGWAVASDGQHTYLYGHCYRQFGFGPAGHAPCSSAVHVARVEGVDLDGPLTYWDGTGWTSVAADAADIAPAHGPDGDRRDVNPMQIRYRDNGAWLAVTKAGDWWGDRVYFDVAESPTGPWTTTAVIDAPQLAPAADTNTYFASFVPTAGSAEVEVVSLSNNRWDGELSDAYRPTFFTVPLGAWGRCALSP